MRIGAWLQMCCLVCAAFGGAALLSGCGSTGDENASLAGTPLKPSHARLKIQRSNELVAAGPAARIRLDGREIAYLGVGAFTMLDVSAGVRNITVDQVGHPKAYTVRLQARAGTLYTLEVSPRGEAVGALFGLVGMMVEAPTKENGGTFQVRVIDAKPTRG